MLLNRAVFVPSRDFSAEMVAATSPVVWHATHATSANPAAIEVRIVSG